MLYDVVRHLSLLRFMCVNVLPAHRKEHHMNAWDLWSQKRGLDPLKLVLQVVAVVFYKRKREPGYVLWSEVWWWWGVCLLKHLFPLKYQADNRYSTKYSLFRGHGKGS